MPRPESDEEEDISDCDLSPSPLTVPERELLQAVENEKRQRKRWNQCLQQEDRVEQAQLLLVAERNTLEAKDRVKASYLQRSHDQCPSEAEEPCFEESGPSVKRARCGERQNIEGEFSSNITSPTEAVSTPTSPITLIRNAFSFSCDELAAKAAILKDHLAYLSDSPLLPVDEEKKLEVEDEIVIRDAGLELFRSVKKMFEFAPLNADALGYFLENFLEKLGKPRNKNTRECTRTDSELSSDLEE